MSKSITLLTAQAFASDGPLARISGRHTVEQGQYALHVAGALERKDYAQSLLEAETGTGKSLGYIIPAMIALSQHKGSRIVISTFTRALQNQVMNSDLPLAVQVLNRMGITPPSYAFRMGRQAFWSPLRVQMHVQSLLAEPHTPEQADAWRNLLAFARNSAHTGSGLWLDYLDAYGRMPEKISVLDVCLTENSVPDNPAYDRHLEAAREAALIVTNHATLLVNQRTQVLGGDFYAVIVDEAHEVQTACESFTSLRTQPARIQRTLERIGNDKLKAQLQELTQSIHDHDDGEAVWTDGNRSNKLDMHRDAIAAIRDGLRTALSDLRKAYKGEALSQDEAANLEALQGHEDTLTRWLDHTNGFKQRAIAFSEKLRLPSIASVDSNAGHLFGRVIANMTERVILTSATLADAKRNDSFDSICRTLGLAPEDTTDSCRLYPHQYGRMRFVLTPATVSKPVLESGELTAFNIQWLAHAAEMIKAAMADGSTLVLCQSFEEARMLGQRVKGLLVHEAGQNLHEVLPDFRARAVQGLITPSAWEGISLRDSDGNQLIENLVITRLPFAPPNHLIQRLRTDFLRSRGLSDSVIKSILWAGQQQATVTKLRQGLGRGIRHPNDVVTVWFADPRMPAFGSKGGLLSAIPRRFATEYANATVFGQAKKPDLVMV